MVIPTVYGGYCELIAAGNIFPFLFEIDVYLPYNSILPISNNFNVTENIMMHSDILQFSNNLNNITQSLIPTTLDNMRPISNSSNVTESVNLISSEIYNSNHLENTENSNDQSLGKKRKRRSRCTDRVRSDQVKQAKKKLKITKPQSNCIAVQKYHENHPEIHRTAALTYQRNHPEVHRQSQNLYEKNNTGIRTENSLRQWKIKKLSGLAYDPKIDYKNYIGSMTEKCKYCHALKWKGETPGMCCNNGKVQLDPLQPPPEPLRSLLNGDHPDHEHFKDCTPLFSNDIIWW